MRLPVRGHLTRLGTAYQEVLCGRVESGSKLVFFRSSHLATAVQPVCKPAASALLHMHSYRMLAGIPRLVLSLVVRLLRGGCFGAAE